MSKVRATETKPEIAIRKYLFSKGFRFKKNVKSLPGTPDIVLPKFKIVIFVHGCFWHGHKNCKASTLPKTKIKYWTNKIATNISRDKTRIKELKKLGWRIITIWECKIRTNEKMQNEMLALIGKIHC